MQNRCVPVTHGDTQSEDGAGGMAYDREPKSLWFRNRDPSRRRPRRRLTTATATTIVFISWTNARTELPKQHLAERISNSRE
jgi:hypothetical protein